MQNYNSKLKISFKLLVVVFSFSLLVFSLIIPTSSARAAVLYLEPSEGTYHVNDTFLVEVRIDVEDKCINVVDVNLSFSQDILKAVNFSRGNSILTLWLKEPLIDQNQGLISFTGGIPGGYCGILPGDPGKTNLLGRIIFQVKETNQEQTAKIEFLDTSQVLLNDGLGTPAKLTSRGAIFTVLPEKLEVPKDEWLQELKKDNIPPEFFEIEIHQDPAIFDGKYFIVFSTTDKQTGIDYYEVKEGERDWQRVESPYLLEDQSLGSRIKVRAVDKAGNERVVKYIPPKVEKPFPWWLIFLILVGVGIIIWRVIKKRKTKSAKEKFKI